MFPEWLDVPNVLSIIKNTIKKADAKVTWNCARYISNMAMPNNI